MSARRSVQALVRSCLAFALFAMPACAPAPPSRPPPPPPAAAIAAPALPSGLVAFARPPGPAIRLRASDGTDLRLLELTARGVVADPLALTELRLVFSNPHPRVLEGTFSIALPAGAAVSRFAMRQDDGWQEGEVVEQRRARAVYEDFLHRKQDPALLERAAGNEWSVRVFPIPAHGHKELLVGYSQELASDAPYAIGTQGLGVLDSVDIALHVAGQSAPALTLRETRWQPRGDVGIDLFRRKRAGGVRADDLVVARVRPVAQPRPDPVGSLLVLLDTSASRALGLRSDARLVADLGRLLRAARGREVPLSVACFDQEVEAVFHGDAGRLDDSTTGRIERRQALGASNLERALAFARDEARDRGLRRVLLVTDAIATAGALESAELRAVARSLAGSGVERLDVALTGGTRDDDAARKIATAGLPRDGVVADAARGASELLRRLDEAAVSAIPVRVPGARWWWPRWIDGAQSGDEAFVYAEVPDAEKASAQVGQIEVPFAGFPQAERALLARSVAQARIQSLLHREAVEGPSEQLRLELVQLSTAERVLSPYTSFVVLETERDYERFGIDRHASRTVLSIDGGRVARVQANRHASVRAPAGRAIALGPELERAVESAPSPEAAGPVSLSFLRQGPGAEPRCEVRGARCEAPSGFLPQGPRADTTQSKPPAVTTPEHKPTTTFGSGGLGLSGTGQGGGARGAGIGATRLDAAGPARPRVALSNANVSGRLATEIIQRIVRQSYGRMRVCYENALWRDPTLGGRVVVRFLIDAAGHVPVAQDAGSTVRDPAMIACVANAFRAMAFPAPDRGTVTVVYPILFSPEAGPLPPGGPGEPSRPAKAEPWVGPYRTVARAIASGELREASRVADAWRSEAPGDVMALVALGDVAFALGEERKAARAYGSIIDLFPARADLRRFAGERLERLAGAEPLALALDTYHKAVAQRPDHPSGHRLYAYALLKARRHESAFDAIATGLAQRYRPGRLEGVQRLMREDLGLVAAAWAKAEPARRPEIVRRLNGAGGALETAPSVRFVLYWETDANDVDFHVWDDKGGHAFYASPALPGGGELYADVRAGFGPECFTVRGPRHERAAVYTLQAHYFARGPMGYGMGKLEVLEHDGQGTLRFEERPYVVMTDKAYVDLGEVKR